MSESALGSRNKQGHWRPHKLIRYPEVFVWPPKPMGIAKFLAGVPGYFVPWNLLYGLIALGVWFYLAPSLETAKTFAAGWILFILVRNAAIVTIFYGGAHLYLYVTRAQGGEFKYNSRWPTQGNSAFLFKNQHIDNMIWTYLSAVPQWTAFEAVTLWAFGNGYIPCVSFSAHPIYCTALFLLIPLWRETHFYLIHRLIHAHVLYSWVHKTHHNNVNPGPYSGLAMSPFEHLLYFSTVLIHWIVPSHPAHAIFSLMHAGLSPAPGHSGFYQFRIGRYRYVDASGYHHYLHHRLFECNYGGVSIPVDKWFGTFHDGSPEAEVAMNKRFKERGKELAEKRAARAARRDQVG